jgi:hypothetical protein
MAWEDGPKTTKTTSPTTAKKTMAVNPNSTFGRTVAAAAKGRRGPARLSSFLQKGTPDAPSRR